MCHKKPKFYSACTNKNTYFYNAKDWSVTDYCKAIKRYKYGHKKTKESPSQKHILAVLFYTNFDRLQNALTKTFRKAHKNETFESVKLRNREYAIWSKTLKQSVNEYGTRMCEQSVNTFKQLYHGISVPMLFKAAGGKFYSPTSMTTSFVL